VLVAHVSRITRRLLYSASACKASLHPQNLLTKCDLGAVPLGVYGLLVPAINTETTPPVQGDSFWPSEILLIAEQN